MSNFENLRKKFEKLPGDKTEKSEDVVQERYSQRLSKHTLTSLKGKVNSLREMLETEKPEEMLKTIVKIDRKEPIKIIETNLGIQKPIAPPRKDESIHIESEQPVPDTTSIKSEAQTLEHTVSKNKSEAFAVDSFKPNTTLPKSLSSSLAPGVVEVQKSDSLQLLSAFAHFNSPEPGVLDFQRGDLIIKTKEIDTNWSEGYLLTKLWYGVFRYGRFPRSYLRVSDARFEKRIASFDFYGDEEEGNEKAWSDLKFSRGDTIFMIDKINNHWGRGLLVRGNCFRLGLFPFVFTTR